MLFPVGLKSNCEKLALCRRWQLNFTHSSESAFRQQSLIDKCDQRNELTEHYHQLCR